MGFAIAMVGLTAILQLSNKSVITSGTALRQSQASRFADEGISWVSGQEKVLGWDGFVSLSNQIYCLNELVWTAVGDCSVGSSINNTGFTRNLKLATQTVGTKTVVQAVVRVGWDESGRYQEAVRVYQYVPY